MEVILVGSNVDRERSIASVLARLLELACPLHVSRIMQTPPVGLIDGGPAFFNLAVALPWKQPTAELKRRLVAIEEALGRNRLDINRSKKSRTADIDPVLRLGPEETGVGCECLPVEPYARAVVVDLLRHLGVEVDTPNPPSFPVAQIPWAPSSLGAEPTSLTRVARRRFA